MADLLSSLWRASYKGAAFWVDHDDERGGRRVVVHQFPRRDEPFLEDLGRAAKNFEVTAYVVGDSYGAAATALVAALDAEGAGLLVLPTHGPVLCRNGPFSRARGKDRAGYIAFTITFFREGAASALASVNFLAQMVFDRVDALAIAAQSLVGLFSLVGMAEWVVAAAVASVQSGVATLEVIRDGNPVDPVQAADLATQISTVYGEIPVGLTRLAVDPAFVADAFDASRALSEALAPEIAAPAFAAEIDTFAAAPSPAGVSANSARVAGNAAVANSLSRLALIAGMTDALIRQDYADRPTAIAARNAAVAVIGAEMDVASTLPAPDVFSALADLRAEIVRFFSAAAADLRPVLTVVAPRELPAVWHAWRLYADPTRAQELIDRNCAPHPAFLSTRFEALAP